MAAVGKLEAPAPHHRRAYLVGRPLGSSELEKTRLPKVIALPIFSSDALSSVAYATEAALGVLLAASAGSAHLVLPISGAVALLMLIVVASYRQTVQAYPVNGGAYVVARENLGINPALIAGAAILIDYLLTVAVSVSAGVLAVTSALPALHPYRVWLAVACVGLLVLANLRGMRESGPAFALPTYLFVGSLLALFLVAALRLSLGDHPHATVTGALPAGARAVGVFLLLRAFASGCSALTGVEAIANGVSAFEAPQSRNARITLAWLGALACTLFLGVSTLAVWTGARPSERTSVLAQVAKAIFGTSVSGQIAFLVVQASTLAVLCLAANASFQGFPRLTALMAHDRFAPRQFENFGDRLVYSNGVLVLGLLAVTMIVVYQANVSSLIHLYVVGVFCAFTLSQAGMVRHWWRVHGTSWRRSITINAVGAITTGVVAGVVVWTKFAEGAWMVVLAVPALVLVFRGINRHYGDLRRRLDVAASSIVEATPFETAPLVVVERSDGATRHALWLARKMAHMGDAEVIAIGPKAARGLVPGLDADGVRIGRIAPKRDLIKAVRESVWALPHGGSRFVTVILPEQYERPRLTKALLTRAFLLKLRLLRESGVATCDVSSLSSLADAALPERVVVRVLVSDARAASLRAAAYADALGFPDAHAVYFASTPEKAQTMSAAWAACGSRLPIEIVPTEYRDITDPVRAYAHQVLDSDPTVAVLYVVPEIVVTGWRRLLHNFRELHIKHSVLFESPRIMLASVPYHVR